MLYFKNILTQDIEWNNIDIQNNRNRIGEIKRGY